MKVILVDDHALVLRGLEELLVRGGIDVVASLQDATHLVEIAKAQTADVILIDVMMPSMDGISALKALRKAGISTPVLMLTMSHDENHLAEALRSGAQGYLLKDMDPDDLLPALQDAIAGKNVVSQEMVGSLTRLVQGRQQPEKPKTAAPIATLTPREKEILRHLADGLSNKEIAKLLGISDGTVKLHVKSILRKLNARSRVEAAVIATQQGIPEDIPSGPS